MTQNSKKPAPSISSAKAELWRRGNLRWKCHHVQKELYDLFYAGEKHSVFTWLLARQSGKCLEKTTLVMTPTGPVEIQHLNVGDTVYGYNEDGSVSPTTILAKEYTGMKRSADLVSHHRVWATASLDHRWAVYNNAIHKIEEKTTSQIQGRKNLKVLRRFVDSPMGSVNEPHAYVIGALLGDGCSKQGVTDIYISSQDELIPKKCAEVLGVKYYSQNEENYTWNLSVEGKLSKGSKKTVVECNYYNEWCRDRYAHEKITDLEVIKTWNRESCLAFLGGLIDTDGCIQVTGRAKNELKISFCSQSKSVIDTVRWLFLALFQVDLCISVDTRKKYVNGPCYTVYTNNNLFVKRALKQLDPYIITPRKKWKPEYEFFKENNTNADYVGLKVENVRQVECYDIQVANETNLYLLANGLVTHNSVLLSILALEQALRERNSIIKFVTDTKIHAKNIIEPIINQLLEDCPEELKPQLKSDHVYYCPNGSQIQMAGTDGGHYERLRGQKSALVLVDEAGFCNDLNYIVNSVLFPTTTHTGGKIVLASTPPKESDHEFFAFIDQAQEQGTLVRKTLYDNPLLDKKQIEMIEKQMGGAESEQFRREYLCHLIRDSSSIVFPEFDEVNEKDVVQEWDIPAYYDTYVSMDLGGKDLTAVLFSYYDFFANKVVVQDEIIFDFRKSGNTIKKLTDLILEKEKELWYNSLTQDFIKPLKRVSDINYIVIGDIAAQSNYQLQFMPAKKDDLASAINNVRHRISGSGLIIDPKCKTTIAHLKSCKWKGTQKATFARAADGSHFDAAAALIYLLREVNYGRNPYPKNYSGPLKNVAVDDVFMGNRNMYNNQSETIKTLTTIFNKSSNPFKIGKIKR